MLLGRLRVPVANDGRVVHRLLKLCRFRVRQIHKLAVLLDARNLGCAGDGEHAVTPYPIFFGTLQR